MIDNIRIDPVPQLVKTRLSLAAFAPIGALSDAVEELGEIGVTPDHMLIASRSSAQAVLGVGTDANTSTTLLRLLNQMQLTHGAASLGTVYASDPEAWHQLSAKHILADDGIDGASRRGVTRRLSLIDEIGDGSTVLIVHAASFSQHRRSVRILLKHGSSRVLTHEFSIEATSRHTSTESLS